MKHLMDSWFWYFHHNTALIFINMKYVFLTFFPDIPGLPGDSYFHIFSVPLNACSHWRKVLSIGTLPPHSHLKFHCIIITQTVFIREMANWAIFVAFTQHYLNFMECWNKRLLRYFKSNDVQSCLALKYQIEIGVKKIWWATDFFRTT